MKCSGGTQGKVSSCSLALRKKHEKHLRRVKVTQNIDSQSADFAHNGPSRLPFVSDPSVVNNAGGNALLFLFGLH